MYNKSVYRYFTRARPSLSQDHGLTDVNISCLQDHGLLENKFSEGLDMARGIQKLKQKLNILKQNLPFKLKVI